MPQYDSFVASWQSLGLAKEQSVKVGNTETPAPTHPIGFQSASSAEAIKMVTGTAMGFRGERNTGSARREFGPVTGM